MRERQGSGAVVALGGLLIAIGSFLPWISVSSAFGSLSRNGVEGGGDGVSTLIIGVLMVLLGISAWSGASIPSILR